MTVPPEALWPLVPWALGFAGVVGLVLGERAFMRRAWERGYWAGKRDLMEALEEDEAPRPPKPATGKVGAPRLPKDWN